MRRDTFEYVTLRVIRRFFFTPKRLHALGAWLPYYRVNQGQLDPAAIAAAYAADLGRVGVEIPGRRILEIGSGATSGVGYALVAMGAAKVVCQEPYAPLDVGLDAKQLNAYVVRHPELRFSVVDRVSSLDAVPDDSIDAVVSNSVLEHVADPDALFASLARVMTPDAVMLHRVDYRDHFFKYPFHFLLFSKFAWKWFLNPGDLPRWRFDDHLGQLDNAGFETSTLHVEHDPEAFAAVADRLHPDYQHRDTDMLSIVRATLWGRRKR